MPHDYIPTLKKSIGFVYEYVTKTDVYFSSFIIIII